jgi:hypothetical protein
VYIDPADEFSTTFGMLLAACMLRSRNELRYGCVYFFQVERLPAVPTADGKQPSDGRSRSSPCWVFHPDRKVFQDAHAEVIDREDVWSAERKDQNIWRSSADAHQAGLITCSLPTSQCGPAHGAVGYLVARSRQAPFFGEAYAPSWSGQFGTAPAAALVAHQTFHRSRIVRAAAIEICCEMIERTSAEPMCCGLSV